MARALGARRSSHSLVVIGWPVSGLFPKPHQYPSGLIFSFGMEPSTTSTNGSSSPRSALKNHSMKSLLLPTGPLSKSINGQCTATFGSPGNAPSAISSMLGWVAAVRATESPSQLNPALIHRMWTTGSSVGADIARLLALWCRSLWRDGPGGVSGRNTYRCPPFGLLCADGHAGGGGGGPKPLYGHRGRAGRRLPPVRPPYCG